MRFTALDENKGKGLRLGKLNRQNHLQSQKILVATGSNPKNWEAFKAKMGHTMSTSCTSFYFNIKDERYLLVSRGKHLCQNIKALFRIWFTKEI